MSPQEGIISNLAQDYGISIENLIQETKKYMPDFNEAKFKKAFLFAAEAHEGQMRRENKPYIYHPIETTHILSSLHADEDTLIASMLHDVPEDTSRTIREVELKFGKNVAFLVDGVTKLSKVHYKDDMAMRQVDSLKKLFLHSARDPRIILIKLADRLHNMRTLQYHDKAEKKVRIANETMEIFVPIANLMGIDEFKRELEDLCFQYLNVDEFASLSERMKEIYEKNAPLEEKTIAMVEDELKKKGIPATVIARHKNMFSIYNKVVSGQKKLEEFDNFLAMRILVPEVHQCYEALGLIHGLFKPKTGKFKDYIAMPKVNNYQSLHTTTFGLQGFTTEFQIRTNKMHLEAEYGIAANFFLATNKVSRQFLEEDKRADWTSKILDIQKEDSYGASFIDDLKLDIFHDRIFVFTPQGRSIDLPQGASCIDFAYQIHTQVGNRALKADVNGEMAPMSTVLQNGDTVRIITSDANKGPERAWLGFVKTNSARNKIREYLKKISREEKIKTGKSLLQKEMDRAGLGLIKDLPSKKIREFISQNASVQNADDIFAAIGEGAIKPLDLLNEFYPRHHVTLGYINLLEGKLDKKRGEKTTTVSIKVVGKNEAGQLEKILKTITGLDINVVKINAYVSKWSGNIICRLTVNLETFSQVSMLFENLEQIDGVKNVSRVFWQRKVFFVGGSLLTFMIWAIHPFVLHFITMNVSSDQHPILASTLLYVGIFMLFVMVFLLKSLTQRSFPEMRETTAFWVMSYLLSTFALITLFAEIYFFRLTFNWVFMFGLIILIFAYLTSEFITYSRRL